MDLAYTDETKMTITVELAAGERLGDFTGPVSLFVPTDPLNETFAYIIDNGFTIGDPP
jgi:hypothetical protein